MAAKVNEDVKKMFEATVEDEKNGKVKASRRVSCRQAQRRSGRVQPDEPLAAAVAIPTPAQVFAKGLASRRDIAALLRINFRRSN